MARTVSSLLAVSGETRNDAGQSANYVAISGVLDDESRSYTVCARSGPTPAFFGVRSRANWALHNAVACVAPLQASQAAFAHEYKMALRTEFALRGARLTTGGHQG